MEEPILRWAARATSIADIERELARIWAAPGLVTRADGSEERHVAARTSVMNLVVVARRPETGERCAATISALGGRDPSRTLIIVSRDPDGPNRLDARIDAHCVLPRGDAPEVCAEVIHLSAGGSTGRHLDAIVAPLLVHDLPVAIWWPGDPAFDTPQGQDLLAMADRLIVDGSAWAGTGLPRLREMAGLLGPTPGAGAGGFTPGGGAPAGVAGGGGAGVMAGDGVTTGVAGGGVAPGGVAPGGVAPGGVVGTDAPALAISDFALARQSRWREAIASVFDAPEILPYLRYVRRIEVTYASHDTSGRADPTNVVKPVYHVAWFGSRLGMTVRAPLRGRSGAGDDAQRGRHLEAILGGPHGSVAVTIRPVQSEMPSGTTLSVELNADRRGSTLDVIVTAEAETVMVSCRRDGIELRPQSFLAPRRTDADLLSEAIEAVGLDTLAAGTIRFAAALAGDAP